MQICLKASNNSVRPIDTKQGKYIGETSRLLIKHTNTVTHTHTHMHTHMHTNTHIHTCIYSYLHTRSSTQTRTHTIQYKNKLY